MTDNYAFIPKQTTFSSSYCKNAFINNFELFDVKAAYLCKSAPMSTNAISELAETAIEDISNRITEAIKNIEDNTLTFKKIITDASCNVSEYDESAATQYSAKIRCHLSNLYLNLILSIDNLVPYIETLYLADQITFTQRNVLLRNLRNNIYEFRTDVEKKSDNVRKQYKQGKSKALNKTRIPNKKRKSKNPLMKVDVPVVAISSS
jgi:hypothetical protein